MRWVPTRARGEACSRQFLAYLDEHGIEQITVDAALAWATLPGRTDSYHAHRLGAVRGFAQHLRAMELPVEVPPSDLLPNKARRAVPYIYTDAEISALLEAAGTLHPAHRVATFRTLIGLLAGDRDAPRRSDRADRADFDPTTGVLIVRGREVRQIRELPLHPTHGRRRHRVSSAITIARCPRPTEQPLLLDENGRRFSPNIANHTFRALAVKAGLRPRSAGVDLARTIYVTALLSARSGRLSCRGTGRAEDASFCPPISATRSQPTRTGIFSRPRIHGTRRGPS